MEIKVGIADMNVSDDPAATIVTHSLGSCIGVTVYDPSVKVGGMLHFMLPEPTDPKKAKEKPFMFCDTGVPLLFKACYELGAKKSRMIVKIAGGAQVLRASETFSIGQRNNGALRKMLFKNNVMIDGEDIGGSRPRTMRLNVGTGEVSVKIPGGEQKVL